MRARAYEVRKTFFVSLNILVQWNFKPISVTTNVVGLQTECQNSSANVVRVVGLQTDAVVVTETRLSVRVPKKLRLK